MIFSSEVDNIIFYTENDWQICLASLISHIMHVLPKAGRKNAGCHDAQKLPLFVRTFAFLTLLFTTLWFFSTLTINPWSYQNSSALQLCRSRG
jgi:hypothetical protein